MTEKFNIYQAVTDRIIAQLEQGQIPWQKPWIASGSIGAFNRVSKKPYSMLNQMMLPRDGEYATFKQWSDLGGKVKKGEKSEIVVFWKPTQITDINQHDEVVVKTIPILRYYNVFHISQVEGVEPLKQDETTFVHEPIEEAEQIRSAYAQREHIRIMEVASDRAFYSPASDYIQIPSKAQYKDIHEFYSTLFHEMIHSTGHKSRLNRFEENAQAAAFGSSEYSKEELVAEIGAAALIHLIGIETIDTFRNSAAYIQSWIKVLMNDNKFIISASSKAEKAVKFILGE